MFYESPAATADMTVLPGVLGCRHLRRTIQVRLGTNTLRLPGGTSIFTVSRQQFMKHPGWTLPICHFSFSISDLTLPISYLSLYIAKSFDICYLTNEKCEMENGGGD
jgi:hypothetical protein